MSSNSSAEAFGGEIFKARPYQVEILEKAKKQNAIVCLGTGTGKTFISVMLIKELQGGISKSLEEDGKRTFFLVNTVPLVKQQMQVIVSNTCLTVGHYTGDMGVDFWNKEKWRDEFNKNDVLVMTAQILHNILTYSFISVRNINLMIIDECHNASGKHPYSKILSMFDDIPTQDQPHVMGLTASIINEKPKPNTPIKIFLDRKMKELEARMRAICLTCSDYSATEGFATKPNEKVFSYEKGYAINDFETVHAMIQELGEYLGTKQELFSSRSKEEKAKNKASKSSRGRLLDMDMLHSFTRTQDMYAVAGDAIKYCKETLDDLGPMCSYEAAKVLLDQLVRRQNSTFTENGLGVLNECSKVLEYVKNTYESTILALSTFPNVESVIPMEPFITKKAHLFLNDILLQEKHYFENCPNPAELHAIIFVQRRATAVILNKLIKLQLQADFENYQGIMSDYVLGHGLDSNIRLADSYMKSTHQNKVLEQFKKGEFNVLVATSVVEEGLDVRKCNLVVRFDGINNYREYVQSKGRARALNSKFIIMAPFKEYDKAEADLELMQTIEKELFEKCQYREMPTDEDIRKILYDEDAHLVPTYFGPRGINGPRITRDSAIELLYRYCALLPGDKYAKKYPDFDYNTTPADEKQAECVLPLSCRALPEKLYLSDWMPTQELAKQHVAMKICKLLHQYNELDDDNFLPVKKVVEGSEDDDEGSTNRKDGTRQNRAFYLRKIPEVLTPDAIFTIENNDLYAISMTLEVPSDRPSSYSHWPLWYDDNQRGFGIFLPKGLPQITSFNLFTKAGAIRIAFHKCHQDMSLLDQKAVEACHQKIMEECSGRYVDGQLLFDINASGVSKGLVVPLKASVFDALQRNRNSELTNVVDVNEMQRIIGEEMEVDESSKESGNLERAVIRKTYGETNQRRRLYYAVGFSDSKTSDCMEGSNTTFRKYYQQKYQKDVAPNTNLLSVVGSSMKISYSEDQSCKEMKSRKQSHKELLVPALCEIASDIPSDLHLRMQFLPYLLYRLECDLAAHKMKTDISNHLEKSREQIHVQFANFDISDEVKVLRKMLNKSGSGNSVSPSDHDILQCLTTRQAKFGFDLERLEMLGDSFLKQAITIHLFFKHPRSDEGFLSTKRKQCISNKNLKGVAKKIDLQHIICNSQFGVVNPDGQNMNPMTVWLPPGYTRIFNRQITCDHDNDLLTEEMRKLPFQEVQDKSMADCIEALIGAYFKTGGVDLALRFMQEYLSLNVLYAAVDDEAKQECKVRPGTSSSYADYPLAEPDGKRDVADRLYERGKLCRLEQRLGYRFKQPAHIVQALTHPSYPAREVNGCYQEYEFLGDAILDFLVTLHIYTKKEDLSPGELTSLRSALVNNNTFALLAIDRDMPKYMFQESPELFHDYGQFVNLVVNKNEDSLERSFFESPFVIVPPGSETGYMAPKVLGDLFESVAGAIFLDSGLDLVKVWEVYYPIMQPVIEKYMDDIPLNPSRELQETFPNIEILTQEEDGRCCCTIKQKGANDVVGYGHSKKVAKAAAAKRKLEATEKKKK